MVNGFICEELWQGKAVILRLIIKWESPAPSGKESRDERAIMATLTTEALSAQVFPSIQVSEWKQKNFNLSNAIFH